MASSVLTIRNIVFIICLLLFTSQVIIIWINFAGKETSIAISQVECDRRGKTLPCITLCPTPGFRDLYNFTVDIESYLDDTFGIGDIFQQEMLERLNDTKKWISKELFTTLMGRCSMTCLQREVKAIEFNKDITYIDITYILKTQRNYQVFIHEPEDTVWIIFSVFAYEITSFFLKTKPGDEMKAADLHIEQAADTIKADKTSHPSNQILPSVQLMPFKKASFQTGNLFAPFLALTFFSFIQICLFVKTQTLSKKMYPIVINNFLEFVTHPDTFGCRSFKLFPFYDTLCTQDNKEYFIYDINNVLASIGGHLGLFLGFSCMNITIFGIKFITDWFGWKNQF